MPSYTKTLLIAFALVLAMLAIAVIPASADEHFISGRVVNQTPVLSRHQAYRSS